MHKQDNLFPELAISPQALFTSFQASDTGITIADAQKPAYPLVFANRRFQEITGYAPEELIGQDYHFLQGAETDQPAWDSLSLAFQQGSAFTAELQNTRKDGTTFWNHMSVSPIHDDAGRLTHFVIFHQDVTAQHSSEAALVRQNDFLAQLYALSLTLLNHREPDTLFNAIVEEATSILGAEYCDLSLVEGDELVVWAYNASTSFLKGDRATRSEAQLSWKAVDTGLPVTVNTYKEWSNRRTLYDPLNIHAVMEVPIMLNDKCVGVLGFSRTRPGHIFDEQDTQKAVVFSQLAALALDNVTLYKDLTRQINERKQAEHELRASEERYRILSELISDYAFSVRVDPDQTLHREWVTDSFVRVTGYTPEALNIASLVNLFHPDDVYNAQLQLQKALQGEQVTDEHRIITPAGEVRWLQISCRPIRDEQQGRVTRIYGIAQDITDRKRTEAAMRASEERYRSLTESTASPILTVSASGELLFANTNAAQGLQVSAESLVGKRLNQVFEESVAVPLLDCVRYVIETGTSFVSQAPYRLWGEERWYQVSVQPVRENHHEASHAMVHAIDITSAKKAEQALQEAYNLMEQRVIERTADLERLKSRSEAILNSSGDGIVVLDIHDGIQQANASFDRLFGTQPDRYYGLPLSALVCTSQADALNAAISSVIRTDSIRLFDAVARRDDGTSFDVEITLASIHESDPTSNHVVCTVRDISERKQAEAALRDSKQMLMNVLENIPVRVFWKDRNSVYQGCNSLHAHSNGLNSPDEIIGLSDHDFLPERADEWRAGDLDIMEKGHPVLSEEHIVDADGTSHWLRANKVPLRDSQGQTIGVLATIEDITERKVSELAVAEERNLLRTLIDALPDSIYVKDREHRLLLSNIAHARQLGFASAAAVIGRTDFDIFSSETAQDTFNEEEKLFQTRTPIINKEERTRGTDGTDFWSSSTKVPLYNLNGEMTGLVGITSDITQIKAGEDALRASEERYRTTIAAMSEGIVLQDMQGTIQFWNSAAERILGLSGEQMAGRSSVDSRWRSIHEDGTPFPGETHPAMVTLRTGEPQSDVVMGVHKPEGVLTWILINSQPVISHTGTLNGVVATFTDITNRKKAEDSLRDSEMRYRSLFEQSNDAVFILDMEGNHLQVNLRASEMLGYSVGELIHLSFRQIITPSEHDHSSMVLERLKQGERLKPYRRTIQRKDGTLFTAEMNVELVRDASGRPLHIQSVIRDVTEREKYVEALQKSEARNRWLIDTMQAGFAIFDDEDRFTYVNDRVCEMMGHPREALIGEPSVKYLDAENRAIVQGQVGQRRMGRSDVYELTLRRQDGSVINTLVSASPMQDDAQVYTGSFALVVDITRQKDVERQLQRTLEQEKELNELKSRFVSMASHEFRTPLAAILATAETLEAYRARMTDDQITERLGKIRSQVLYMRDIMEDVLHLARIQAGRVDYNPVEGSLDALCQQIISEFNSQQMNSGRIHYTCDTPVMTTFDYRLMRQVINNLVSNALKYSPADKVVDIMLSQDSTGVTLQVRDEGIGIPQDDLKHLFEPFHRATNVGTISGTGLGLSITRQAVELHGGTITPESVLGSGSSFTVFIPRLS